MCPNGRREKVAILGGGMAAVTAAYELTDRPGWDEKYEVTVYQPGWRLGGKCASGRNARANQRIEEHGLHVWGGFYENAFRLMRRCYAELGRPPGSPLADWTDAFRPQNFVVFEEQVNGGWVHWPKMLAANKELPGEGQETLPFWEYLGMAIQWMIDAVRSSPYVKQTASPVPGRQPPGWLRRLFSKAEAVFVSVVGGLVAGLEFVGRSAEYLLDVAQALVGYHWAEPYPGDAFSGILWLVDEFMERFSVRLRNEVESNDGARRLWVLLDFFHAAIRGVLIDGVLWNGFGSIDDEDFRAWLRRHGASELTLEAAPLRAFYDYFFAFEDGDVTRPRLAAGVALLHLVRLVFTYKTAIFWEMQAGMGDVVFAPLYEVLRRRGVKFRFFHRVESLHLSDDKRSIAAMRIARQVTLRDGEYRPLVDVKGLPCWPSEPLYEQIVEGEELRARGIDLESPWSGWQDREVLTLRVGTDFDRVILGITLAPLRTICAELAEASPVWRDMLTHLKTVQTLGVQVWLLPDAEALGWTMPPPLMTGYAQLLNTWGDFSHLLRREDWPAAAPRSLAYFCGPFPDAPDIPPPTASDFPVREAQRLQESAVAWLEDHLPHLYPATRNGSGFHWDLLADPAGRQGRQRFAAQYCRANVSPSERYVLSLPGDSRYRLRKAQSGFDNFLVAGDWVYTGLGGCVEGAVMAGMMAARALAGYPEKIVGEV